MGSTYWLLEEKRKKKHAGGKKEKKKKFVRLPAQVLNSCPSCFPPAFWYYAMVRFRTIDLKLHPITIHHEKSFLSVYVRGQN